MCDVCTMNTFMFPPFMVVVKHWAGRYFPFNVSFKEPIPGHRTHECLHVIIERYRCVFRVAVDIDVLGRAVL